MTTPLITIGQSQKMLQSADFKDISLNEEWVYVKFANESERSKRVIKEIKSNASQDSPLFNVAKLKVPKGIDPISYCNKLRQHSKGIIYADPIVQYIPLSTPSDALLSNQFYLDIIRAFEAWDITRGDDDIVVGIIDSGIDLDHEDITTNLWLNTDDPIDGIDNDNNGYVDDYYGYDFADLDTDPSIQNGNHGMIVAGIAGASTNNNSGIAGVGYNTKVAALKGFKSSNGQSGGLYEAIIYAAENGFDIVNLSWGRMGVPLQSEQDILNYAALDKDMVLVAAAGNEGGKSTQENKWYPASYDHVLSVGASDADDNKSSGSTFNHSVDLLAPGVSMYSTVSNNGYANAGPGTSYASPLVAAAAALVKDQFPNLTALQIMERLRVTSDDVYDVGSNSTYEGKLGKGRLNLFRAVSESNVKSLRAEDASLTSSFGENVFFGDTVKVNATLTNHLSAINSPTISISSPNDDFEISNGIFEPGYLDTQDTREISFDVILNDDIAPETAIEIRLDYAATAYSDFQFLDVITSPDYVNFGNDNISMTISGDGKLGFNDYDPYEGSGLVYELDTLMKYAGLMLATNLSSVSDNIISNFSNEVRNQDFTGKEFYKLYHHPTADHFGYSEFADQNRSVIIEQSNMTWANENFILIRYRIINNSASAINNLSFGVFADWDLSDEASNYSAYDLLDNYIFARNDTDNLYAGVQVLGGDSFIYSALDMADNNGNSQDIDNAFSDAEKYDYLVNQLKTTAGDLGAGNDVATINGVTITQLDSYAYEYIDVIFAIADSQPNLESTLSNARNQLDDILLKPRILETFSVCSGSSLPINPSDGTMYEFYEDPLAQVFITTAETFNPGVISKDTLFYVKNVDNNYPSDIFEIQVNLFNEIADFALSTDTLYLDNPTTNVVSFTDTSLDAISWNWDFDQGTLSTIQNPSLSFSEIGTYSITLEVENALGCVDTMTKVLVVANRPADPSFSDFIICPGEDVSINDPTAEKVHVYTFENSSEPASSGTNVIVESIHRDTVIYASGEYGSFESTRVPINIDVLEVTGEIMHLPDTTSAEHHIKFIASEIQEGSTVEWIVNGNAAGTEAEISVPAVEGVIEVDLTITSPDLCVQTLSKEVFISTSPFASQQNLSSCFGEAVEIIPENGTYFGFYEDAQLTSLIKKGTSLRTSEFTQVYVVGLDDGLPGMPIEVNIVDQSFTFSISHTLEAIGDQYKTGLSVVSDNEIDSFKWYLNGELSETSQNPTFFLDKEMHEIILEVNEVNGCTSSDTLTLDLTPPLSLRPDVNFNVFPNPTKGIINIISQETVEKVTLFSLSGKELMNVERTNAEIDFSQFPVGLYLLRVQTETTSYERQLIIE